MSKTFEKGVVILSLFTYEKPVWSLDEIAQETHIPKPTLVRFLKTFTDISFLRRSTQVIGSRIVLGDQYYLGYKLIELGGVASSSIEIRKLALPAMTRLRDIFKSAVQLIHMDNLDGIYLEKVESLHPVLLYTRVGRRAPLYAGACSRIILAFQEEEKINKIVSQPLIQFASGTPKDEESIRKNIEFSRKHGYAYSISELEEGTVSLAVPIFNASNKVEYSVSIAGIEATIPYNKINDYLIEMWSTAGSISKELGYSASYPYGQ